MPFKSKAQMGWMFAHDPEMAKEWAEDTPKKGKKKYANLPEHVRNRGKKKKENKHGR